MRGLSVREHKARRRKIRETVLWREKSRCAYCRCQLTMETMTLDHVVPRSKGGAFEVGNLIASCGPCNSAKGNQEGGKWSPAVR